MLLKPNIAVVLFLLMEHKKLSMKEIKVDCVCFGIGGGMLWEMGGDEKMVSLHWALPTSYLIPKSGPCRISMKYNLKANILDDVCMSPLPLKLNQIKSEHFKVAEFEGVLYLNYAILNSSLMFFSQNFPPLSLTSIHFIL